VSEEQENMIDQFSELEQEFRAEEKGPGSLSPHVSKGAEKSYVGYDIHPENIEALFFDGIGVPRWDSIKAETVAEQETLYMERYNAVMAEYPMIARSNDTLRHVEYTVGEVAELLKESKRILAGTSDPKVIKAASKFSLASEKAIAENAGLRLNPRVE
jgi:hypothetical protein